MNPFLTFNRFFMGLGIVFLAATIVHCVGCGGEEFSLLNTLAEDVSEAGTDGGSNDAKPGSLLPDAGNNLHDAQADGMAQLLSDAASDGQGTEQDSSHDASSSSDSAQPDTSTGPDAATGLCGGSPTASLFCCAVDPGLGILCHNWAGSYCSDLDAGSCHSLDSSCSANGPIPGSSCAGVVCGWDNGARCE